MYKHFLYTVITQLHQHMSISGKYVSSAITKELRLLQLYFSSMGKYERGHITCKMSNKDQWTPNGQDVPLKNLLMIADKSQ